MNKLYGMLGLAQKAGKVAAGTYLVKQAFLYETACLLIIAEDTSERTALEFTALAQKANVKCIIYGDKAQLGKAIGKPPKNLIAVNDSGFAAAILKIYGEDA
ncbi:MAG: ribosomal L7Ae/L30e/S12e/Gadd45 family protein [Clostridia bacterium]|nr:ribosomal L7Ae/L30e/S12e/Gadd45 family protein [Clostridia bacterium]